MIFRCVFLLLLFTLHSCSTRPSSKSLSDLRFEEQKIVEILADVHYAKSASRINIRLNRDSLFEIYSKQLFEIHEISKQDYEEIVSVLESDLGEYYRIEQKVHAYIKSIKDESSSNSKKR